MRKLIFVIALVAATAVFADTGRYIVDISAKKLYVYNEAGDEIGELKPATAKKNFTSIPGGDKTGLAIVSENAEEGLLQVKLSEFPDPVWLETMSVKTWPSSRLKCPEATTGRAEVEQAGMTIGFGDRCEPEDQ